MSDKSPFPQFHPIALAQVGNAANTAFENFIADFTKKHAAEIDRRIESLIVAFEGYYPSLEIISKNGRIVHIDGIPTMGGHPSDEFTSFFVWRRLLAVAWRVDVREANVSTVFKVMPIDACPHYVRNHIATLPFPE